jgi:hypothetical protein
VRCHHLLTLLLCTSCSFVAVRGPGSVGPEECNRGYWLPAGDIVILAPAVAFVTFAAAYGCSEGNPGIACDVVPGVLMLSTLATVASGIYGIVTVTKCRATPEPEEPPPPPPHVPEGSCLERRAELQRAALAEPDVEKRTQMLQALPSC